MSTRKIMRKVLRQYNQRVIISPPALKAKYESGTIIALA